MPFVSDFRHWIVIITAFFVLFVFHLSFEYSKFKDFKYEPVKYFDGTIQNIYPKKDYNVIKIVTPDYTIFTSTNIAGELNKSSKISGYVITKDITFLHYIKGFYGLTFGLYIYDEKTNIQKISNYIEKQHTNSTISQLFDALFLAIPINKELRDQCAVFGVSHLVAISGFHLGILSSVIFFVLYYPYNIIHKLYFPYRNKRFDILIVTSFILFIYLILTGFVPSLLRAFVMFVLGIYFLRSNIKIISFETLLLVVLLVLLIFPQMLFSLSFWFSVSGVFYIFLFLHYFKSMSRILQFVLFNIWIYLAMNPIAHYFFDTTSLAQLFSPLFTLGFTVFYPVELFLHIISFGGLFDGMIEYWLALKFDIVQKLTPTLFFILYIGVSFLSIRYKNSFIALNILLCGYSLWLYM